MHSFKMLALALLALLWAAPAHAMTMTSLGKAACDTAANSCSVAASGTVAAGGTTMIIAAFNQYAPTSITASDSAGNCSSAYTYQSAVIASGGYGMLVVAYCPTTTAAITSGTTTFTIAFAGTVQPLIVTAWSITGNRQSVFFDKKGTLVTGQWTSGTAVAGSTSGTLGWSSEDVISVVYGMTTSSADTVGSYTGGYSSVAAYPGSNNRPGLWISKQTLTTGAATVGFTPTSAAARYYLSQTFSFVNAGATATARPTRTLLGVGQ
jgi:hypothetical protein